MCRSWAKCRSTSASASGATPAQTRGNFDDASTASYFQHDLPESRPRPDGEPQSQPADAEPVGAVDRRVAAANQRMCRAKNQSRMRQCSAALSRYFVLTGCQSRADESLAAVRGRRRSGTMSSKTRRPFEGTMPSWSSSFCAWPSSCALLLGAFLGSLLLGFTFLGHSQLLHKGVLGKQPPLTHIINCSSLSGF